MDIYLKNKEPVTLQTANKYCKEDININIETEQLNIKPSSTQQIKEGLFDKVTVEATGEENAVVVEVAPSGATISKLIKKLPTLDFSAVTSMIGLFQNCINLEEISIINASQATTMQRTFYNSTKLQKVSVLGTTKLTTLLEAFYLCSALKTVEMPDTGLVSNFDSTFMSCTALEEAPSLNTANASTFNSMFYECTNLKTIPLLDASKVIDVKSMFRVSSGSMQFENLGGFKNLGKAYTTKLSNAEAYALDLHYSTKLTHDSLMNVINNLYDLNLTYDVANGGTLYTQKLILGSTNMAKLTAEEIAIATNKGWNVS